MPQLAALIREKHPGVYDDMSDAELESAVRAKFPGAYDDIQDEPAKPKSGYDRAQDMLKEDSPFGNLARGADAGGVSPGALAGKLATLAKRAAEPVMDMAYGAQAAVKSKFPNVNIAQVALREGVGPGQVGKANQLGLSAARGVHASGRAADAAGAAPIRAREIISELRPIFNNAKAAERGGIAGETARVMKVVKDLRAIDRGGGIGMADALKAKSRWQRLGNPKHNAQAGQQVAIDPEIAAGVGGAFNKATRARSAGIGDALDRSQELMALQRATKTASGRQPLLRMLLGATAGSGVGVASGDVLSGVATAAIPIMAMSPRGLGMAAKGIDKSAEPTIEAIVRMLANHARSGQ